jgi:hypothetical protein
MQPIPLTLVEIAVLASTKSQKTKVEVIDATLLLLNDKEVSRLQAMFVLDRLEAVGLMQIFGREWTVTPLGKLSLAESMKRMQSLCKAIKAVK